MLLNWQADLMLLLSWYLLFHCLLLYQHGSEPKPEQSYTHGLWALCISWWYEEWMDVCSEIHSMLVNSIMNLYIYEKRRLSRSGLCKVKSHIYIACSSAVYTEAIFKLDTREAWKITRGIVSVSLEYMSALEMLYYFW